MAPRFDRTAKPDEVFVAVQRAEAVAEALDAIALFFDTLRKSEDKK